MAKLVRIMKNAPRLILLALALLFPSASPAQGFASSPSFEPDYLGIFHKQTQYIQQLQIEIPRKERSIYTTIQQNRFKWFNRWDLIQYHNDIQQAKLEVAQLRWQLSTTFTARNRTQLAP